jgi:GNAT superfamily N-acetyltransferase
MPAHTANPDRLTFQPVTPDRWADVEAFFEAHGMLRGCWCMWWRRKRSEFYPDWGQGNQALFREIVEEGRVPGLLAYDGDQPVGWVSVAPREVFPVLQRSPVLRPVDGEPVWSIVCFFVHRDYRGKGVTARLVQAAAAYARQQGARIIEGYPYDPPEGEVSDSLTFTGQVSAFTQAGFREVARRSAKRPILRYVVGSEAG